MRGKSNAYSNFCCKTNPRWPLSREALNAGAELLAFLERRRRFEALRALVKADAEKWWPLIKEFGIKAE
jgi:hypothetical protein